MRDRGPYFDMLVGTSLGEVERFRLLLNISGSGCEEVNVVLEHILLFGVAGRHFLFALIIFLLLRLS